jgi:hypothetical protein
MPSKKGTQPGRAHASANVAPDASFEGHLDRSQDRLLVMLQDERQDVDHLAITAGLAQHVILQLSERVRQFEEWCAVTKGPRLPLHDRQIVSPVVDRLCWQMMAALHHTGMFVQDGSTRTRDDVPVA